MKRTRSQSTEAGLSKKKTRPESVTEVPSKGISSLVVDLEPVHAGSEEMKALSLYREMCRVLSHLNTNQL